MSRLPLRDRNDDEALPSDAGLSLVELIIYILLASLLLGLMATILANSWTTQQDVQTKSDATNRGQLIGQTIERAMRNAQAFDVSAAGTLLRVDTRLAGERRCQAFWVSGGAIYQTSSWGTRPDLSADPLPATVSTLWPKPWISAGAKQRDTATLYFTQNGLEVEYAFDIDLADDSAGPVRFQGSAAMRTPATGGTTPCWS